MTEKQPESKPGLVGRLKTFVNEMLPRKKQASTVVEKPEPTAAAAPPPSNVELIIVPESHLGFHIGEEEIEDNIQSALTARLESINQHFYGTGYREGWNGKESTNTGIKRIAQYRVRFIQQEMIVAAKKELKGLKVAYKAIKGECKRLKRELTSQQEYFSELKKQSRIHSREFSKRLGRMYLAIGILLVLADIPLAVELTKKGFGLALEKGYAIQELFSAKAWYVFSTNWEVFVMAIGVAFCTIYIKIFWDEFLASPIENAVRQYKDLPDVQTEEEKKIIARNRTTRIWVKGLILGLTITMIGILGVFRAATMQREIDRDNKIREIALTQRGQTQTQIAQSKTENLRGIEITAFIAITLAFPIIGGICMSKGISCVHNRNALIQAEKHRDELQDRMSALKKNELREADEGVTKMEEQLSHLEDPDFPERLTDEAYSQYLLGFSRGLGASMSKLGNDHYELAKAYRSKLSKKKIFESLSDSEEGGSNRSIVGPDLNPSSPSS